MIVTGIEIRQDKLDKFITKAKHCLSPYIKRDAHVYLFNNGSHRKPISMDRISTLMDKYDEDETTPASNKLVLVSLGWHDSDENFDFSNMEEESIYKESDDFYEKTNNTFFFDGPFAFDKNKVYPNEYVSYDRENNHAMITLLRSEQGYYVMFLLWDWMAMSEDEVEGDNGQVNYFSYWMNKIIPDACVEPIFYKKFAKQYNKEIKVYKEPEVAKSASQIIHEKYNTEEAVNAICEEMIAKVDMKTFNDCFRSVLLQYRKDYPSKEKIHDYLMKWAKANWPLYVFLGNNLIFTTKVSVKPDKNLRYSGYSELMLRFPKYAATMAMFNEESVENNTAKDAYISTYVKTGGRRRDRQEVPFSEIYPEYKNNMKLTKLFSKMFNDDKFDIEMSKIYQDKEAEYDMCFSIHPMDYITSSLSKAGWTSCHRPWGGARPHAFSSLMFDNSTVVCYICDGQSYQYEKYGKTFEWNSKVWRQLITVGLKQNSSILQREYPQFYYNGLFTEKSKSVIKSLFDNITGNKNEWNEVFKGDTNEQVVGREEREIVNNLYVLGDGYTHYDDIPVRKMYYIYTKNSPSDRKKKIVVGGKGYCPYCGKPISDTCCYDCR